MVSKKVSSPDDGSESDSSEVLAVSDFETQFVAEDGDRDALWEVEKITAEEGNKYKIKWVGLDPATGRRWPQSWVPKHDCTDELVMEWKIKQAELRKAKDKAKRKKSNAGSSTKSESVPVSKSTTRASRSVSITKHRPPPKPAVASSSRIPASPDKGKKRRVAGNSDTENETDYESMPARRNKRRKGAVDAPKKSSLRFQKFDEEESPPSSSTANRRNISRKGKQVVREEEGEDGHVEEREPDDQEEGREAVPAEPAKPPSKVTGRGSKKRKPVVGSPPESEDEVEPAEGAPVNGRSSAPIDEPPPKKKRKVAALAAPSKGAPKAGDEPKTRPTSHPRSRSSHRQKPREHEAPLESIQFDAYDNRDTLMDTRPDSPEIVAANPPEPHDDSGEFIPETQSSGNTDGSHPINNSSRLPSKKLGPLPLVSPSKLRPHALAMMDPPASVIDEFSPRKSHHPSQEEAGDDEDDIDESLMGQYSQQVRENGPKIAERSRPQKPPPPPKKALADITSKLKPVDEAAAGLQAELEPSEEEENDLMQYVNFNGPDDDVPQSQSQEEEMIPPTATVVFSTPTQSPARHMVHSPTAQQQYDAAMKLCNEKSEEIIDLTRRLSLLEADLTMERDTKMLLQEHIDRIEVQLAQTELQLTHAQSLATVVPAATLNGPSGEERAAWTEKEAEWEAERARLVAKFKMSERDREAAEQRGELFQAEHARATEYSMETRRANVELKAAAEQAEGRAREGVQQVRAFFAERLKQTQKELAQASALCKILQTRDERMEGEAFRRRAAIAPELELMVARLRKEKADLQEELDERVEELDTERKRADEASAQLAVLESQRDAAKHRGWFGMFGGGPGGGTEHANGQDGTRRVARERDSGVNIADEADGQEGDSEEDAEGSEDDSGGEGDGSQEWICDWAAGPSFARCGAVLQSVKELDNHIVQHHFTK